MYISFVENEIYQIGQKQKLIVEVRSSYLEKQFCGILNSGTVFM